MWLTISVSELINAVTSSNLACHLWSIFACDGYQWLWQMITRESHFSLLPWVKPNYTHPTSALQLAATQLSHSLTYHSCFVDGLRGSSFPRSSTGCYPLLCWSFSKESILQCLCLAWGQQDVKQLSLLLDSICKGLLCGSSDRLEAQLWSQTPMGSFLHLQKSFTEKCFHVGQFWNWLQAESAGSQWLAWG